MHFFLCTKEKSAKKEVCDLTQVDRGVAQIAARKNSNIKPRKNCISRAGASVRLQTPPIHDPSPPNKATKPTLVRIILG